MLRERLIACILTTASVVQIEEALLPEKKSLSLSQPLLCHFLNAWMILDIDACAKTS
jgi:hypothetical protein